MPALGVQTQLARCRLPVPILAGPPLGVGDHQVSKTPMIAIIDYDDSVRGSTRALVRSLGYTAQTFASAEDFLSSDHRGKSNCIIADVQGKAWMVICVQGLRALVKKRAFLYLMLVAWIPCLVRAVQIYVVANFPQASFLEISSRTFRDFLDQQELFVFFITVYAGSGAGRRRSRHRAHPGHALALGGRKPRHEWCERAEVPFAYELAAGRRVGGENA